MQYVEAFALLIVVFVVPFVIISAIIAKPVKQEGRQDNGRRPIETTATRAPQRSSDR